MPKVPEFWCSFFSNTKLLIFGNFYFIIGKSLNSFNIKNSSRYVLLLRHTEKLKKNTIVHEAAHTLGLTHTYREESNDIQPKVFFKKDETKNIMDEGREYKNNNSFWKWQWEEMQKDSDLKPIDNE